MSYPPTDTRPACEEWERGSYANGDPSHSRRIEKAGSDERLAKINGSELLYSPGDATANANVHRIIDALRTLHP